MASLAEEEAFWIFSLCSELPVRLEFFGDMIESIREFDPETQKVLPLLIMLILSLKRKRFVVKKYGLIKKTAYLNIYQKKQ
jgi:transcription-repair coupling factor (superfamily II helicase)